MSYNDGDYERAQSQERSSSMHHAIAGIAVLAQIELEELIVSGKRWFGQIEASSLPRTCFDMSILLQPKPGMPPPQIEFAVA